MVSFYGISVVTHKYQYNVNVVDEVEPNQEIAVVPVRVHYKMPRHAPASTVHTVLAAAHEPYVLYCLLSPNSCSIFACGKIAPGRTRTCNLVVRRQFFAAAEKPMNPSN